jgi:hypothetical protein
VNAVAASSERPPPARVAVSFAERRDWFESIVQLHRSRRDVP